MTFGYGPASQPDGWSEAVLSNKEAEDCLIPMGFTSENVASDFNISREAQDRFAAQSFQKAAAAQKAGKFKAEIVPIKVKFIDPKTEKEREIVVDADDGIRDGVTPQSLAKLRPAFTKTGSTHAGMSRQFF
jgi:acetyl-CoA acyltransferase 1